MSTRTYGSKYDAELSTPEIAARVRAEIKAAVKAGELPSGRYSVRSERYSGGSSITIRVSDLDGVELFNRVRMEHDLRNPHAPPLHDFWASPRYREVESRLEAMLNAYNYDGSDIQTDYFDVNFYGHVQACIEWNQAQRAALAAEFAERGTLAPTKCARCLLTRPLRDGLCECCGAWSVDAPSAPAVDDRAAKRSEAARKAWATRRASSLAAQREENSAVLASNVIRVDFRGRS